MPDLSPDLEKNPAADRLPEAGSLPDGFVESPESGNAYGDYKELNVEPSGEVEIGLTQNEKSPVVALETESGPRSSADGGLDRSGEVSRGSSRGGGDSRKPDAADEGCVETRSTDVKEKAESDRKESSLEVKRKSAKRSSKAEKDLLDLTFKSQQVLAERDAAIAVREKLESLCRELQRQNKMLMDQCKKVSTEGQNLRDELSTRFNDAIKDVSHKLEEQKDECLLQLKENETLRDRLKHFSDQYAVAEQQFQQKLKQKMLELQLANLKLQQHEEKSGKVENQMKLYAEQVSVLLETEKNLRVQLAANGEKFQQFQDALVKSNEVFETFKQEMEKMAKSMKELRKENVFLKSKCEKTDVSLIELVEEREYLKKQLDKVKSQKEKLESLCRSLQAERKQQLSGDSTACDSST